MTTGLDIFCILAATCPASNWDSNLRMSRGSIAPLVTPDEKRGRVSAMENVFIGASNELGAFESGAVSSLVGTPATVIGGGIATMVVAGVWWVAFPSLRGIDRFEDLEDRIET